jgi:hypothetical protein
MANSFINKKSDLTTTDLTTLYTVPSFKSAVVKSLLVSEDAGSGKRRMEMESEVLKVQAADANELHVIASILEIQPREVTT